MKIIFTARDFGAFKQIEAFINLSINQKINLDYIILAQNPEFKITNIKKKKIIKIFEKNLNYKKLENIFDKFSPNFLLSGLSAYCSGIDDILREIAKKKNIESGAIQDYWGYLGGYLGNKKYKNLPDYFFVIDKLAKKLTKSNLPKNSLSKIIITGSPKHYLYKEKVKKWLKLIQKKPKKTIHIFMQTFDIPGILENYTAVLKSFSLNKNKKFKIFIHKHPSDKTNRTYNLADKFKINYSIAKNKISEIHLLHADLVVTFYSTIGLDHNYLYSFSKKPIGELIYVNIGIKMKNWIKKTVGLPIVPGSLNKLGITVDTKEKLDQKLNKFMNGKKLYSYYSLSAKQLEIKKDPNIKILNVIKQSVRREL